MQPNEIGGIFPQLWLLLVMLSFVEGVFCVLPIQFQVIIPIEIQAFNQNFIPLYIQIAICLFLFLKLPDCCFVILCNFIFKSL